MSTLSEIVEWVDWFFRGGYRDVFLLIFSWFIIIVFIYWLIYVGYTKGILHYLILIVVLLSISLVIINNKIKNNLKKVLQNPDLKLEKHHLVKKGIETIIKEKQREYLPFRLIEKIKDVLKKNPSTPNGWIKKYLRLKSKNPIHSELSYCLGRSLLLNPFNAYVWYTLSIEYGIYLNDNYKNASKIYMRTARSINPNVQKEE